MNDEVESLLERQNRVISRRQVLATGCADHDIRRMLRRRVWARAHDGVYVDHTGPLSWIQRAWAAVLVCAPAALCHSSAVRAAHRQGCGTVDDDDPIHVAVDRQRSLDPPDGVTLHRLSHLDRRILPRTSPPRQRIEHATLDLAASADRDIDAVAHLADVVGAGLTTGDRLAAALSARARIARRHFLRSVIEDVRAGTCSTLERGYLDLIERRHGLPTGARQVRESRIGSIYRDVVYENHGLVLELDGRLFHSSVSARDRDLERDLDALATGRVTARLGWRQVFERACRTAERIGAALAARGWMGKVMCGPTCPPLGRPQRR